MVWVDLAGVRVRIKIASNGEENGIICFQGGILGVHVVYVPQTLAD